MIRINLLSGEREVEKAPAFTLALPAGQQLAMLGGLILLLTGVLLGWRYWSLTEEEAELQTRLASAQQEVARLAEVLKEQQALEDLRTQSEQRKTLINDLLRGQTAPVHMIDQVSRALPDMMWLTAVKQVNYDVTIEGRCLSLTALSDFVGNLASSGYFARPVEIVDSAVEAAQQGEPEQIRFIVKATFQMSGIPNAPATGGNSGGNGG